MRFKKSPQLPGAERTRAWHHHGSHTPTSPGAILLSKMACQPKHFGRQCMHPDSDLKIIAVCRAKLRILVVKFGLISKGILNLAPSELSSHSDLFPIWFGFLRMEHN